MDFLDGFEVIQEAMKQRQNEQLYMRWIYGGYDKNLSFSQFCERMQTAARAEDETPEDILNKVLGMFGGDSA